MDLRDEYADIRLLFQQGVTDLNNIHNLNDIPDASYLSAKIEEITDEFESQVNDIKNLTLHKCMKFVSFSLGVLSICTVPQPYISVPAALSALIVEKISDLDCCKCNSNKKTIHRMISGLNADVYSLAEIRKLV
ncbi:hypothetical protein [Methanolobus psychrotolerans]|uniref:hypothetical protein n=1 Tax=Methanolobus psychrotolerans TaxID=1874706 RepID=UPI000B915B0B|nr:hypothetical protein [Methanolobus psychrotolerans]